MGKSSKADKGEAEQKQEPCVEKDLLDDASAMDIKLDNFKIDLNLGDQKPLIDKSEQNEMLDSMAGRTALNVDRAIKAFLSESSSFLTCFVSTIISLW